MFRQKEKLVANLPDQYQIEVIKTEPLSLVVRLLRPYSFSVTFTDDGGIVFGETNAEPTSIAFFSGGVNRQRGF